MVLNKNFYNQKTLKVARELLGCFLCRRAGGKIIRGMIIETEAYCGQQDKASHASHGKTSRTRVMFGPAGISYVYLIYGMHYCLNIVTEKEDYPAAVLIRGVRLENGEVISGPGRVCRRFKIDKGLNGYDLSLGKKLWLETSQNFKKENYKIVRTPRIGVDYAKEYKDKKWRFILDKK